MCASMSTALPSALYFLFIFIFLLIFIYFSLFFSQHKCALSNTKKTYPDGISIAPLTDVAAAVPHSNAGEGGTPRSCVSGACASHHASTTVGGPKATPSGIATPPPGTPSRLTGPSYMRGRCGAMSEEAGRGPWGDSNTTGASHHY